MLTLDSSVTIVSPIAKALGKRLKHLGITAVRDLVFYFPFRYEDWSKISPISSLHEPAQTTIRGRIDLIANRRSPYKRKLLTEALISDESGSIRVVWFNQPYLAHALKVGDKAYFSGKADYDKFGMQMISPAYEKERAGTLHTARIVPIYPVTRGVTEKQLRFLISRVIHLSAQVADWLSDDLRLRFDLIPLKEALQTIHFPENNAAITKALRRLKFDELLLAQLRIEGMRRDTRESQAPAVPFHETETRAFVSSLPFQLTNDQRRAAWEILRDMAGIGEPKNRRTEEPKNNLPTGSSVSSSLSSFVSPMNRLLEGDVGSGKTVVAAIAMLNAALGEFQSVLMAPTEILARQHFETISGLLSRRPPHPTPLPQVGEREQQIPPLPRGRGPGVREGRVVPHVALLTSSFIAYSGSDAKPSKKKLIEMIQRGEVDIAIGTHALLQERVSFHNLALAIVDEQHRFGVSQRRLLKEKTAREHSPKTYNLKPTTLHFLSMTATPIPRSLALSMYGDLDLSLIREMPKGRKQITTKVVDPLNRTKAYEFIRNQVKQGRQVFVICPLIDPSDKLGVKSATEEAEKLRTEVFTDLRVGLLHGRMKSKAKEEVMQEFLDRKLDVLVSTAVVEVGVDVPNASVMMIEGAERFGLAQLHQFRGRVGRAEHQSYCFLFTDSPSQGVAERLGYFVGAHDGFALAEKDLEMRGPGEMYGAAQSGFPEFKLATLKDVELIKEARDAAHGLFEEDSSQEKYPSIWAKLLEWEQSVHLE